MNNLISVKNIEKSFSKNKILKNLTMNIKQGSISGLIGKSGAGKTTLMKTIIGFHEIDKGEIYVNNQEVSKNKNSIRKKVGFTTQEGCFYEELTVKDNLDYFGKMYGLNKEKIKIKTQALLNLVQLSNQANLRAEALSGGMKRRLDIAISLIHGPDLLIMDEPTTGLDFTTRKAIWNLIKKINAVGVTVLISSHLLDEIEYLCDNVFIIKDGAILINGSPNKLKKYYSRFVRVQIGLEPAKYKELIDNLKENDIEPHNVSKAGYKAQIYIADIERLLVKLPSITKKMSCKIIELNIETPDLNEVFEGFTK